QEHLEGARGQQSALPCRGAEAHLGRKFAIWLAQDFAQATQRAHIGAVPEVTQDRADQDGDDRDNEAAAQLMDMIDDAHRAVGGAAGLCVLPEEYYSCG